MAALRAPLRPQAPPDPHGRPRQAPTGALVDASAYPHPMQEQPRIANFQPANERTGKMHNIGRPGIAVLVDLVWHDGVQEHDVPARMPAWYEVGEGDERRMTGCFIEWTDPYGYNRAAVMPPEAVRRQEQPAAQPGESD